MVAATAAAFVDLAWRPWRHERHGIATRFMTLVMAITLSAITFLAPGTDRPPPPAPGLRLVDGTTLAIQRVSAVRTAAGPPLLVVHGGPGIPMTSGEREVIQHSFRDRDVVFYDQIGSGGSSRLTHPSEYTLPRAVADLSAIVDSLHVPSVVLMGYSWGAVVVTMFAASHPHRVDRLVLLSPGALPLPGAATPSAQPQARLSLGDSTRLYANSLEPRNLFVYLLTLSDIDTAHRFASDAEMDRRFMPLYRLAAKGTTCAAEHVGSSPARLGYYAGQYPQVAPPEPLNRVALSGLNQVPTLILRGRCDYLPRAVAQSYLPVIPRARFVDVADAGHALIEERPEVFHDLVTQFLHAPLD